MTRCELPDSVRAVVRLGHEESFDLEEIADVAAKVFVVVDDEHATDAMDPALHLPIVHDRL